MKYALLLAALTLPLSTWAQHDPDSIEGLIPVMSILAPNQQDLKSFKIAAGKDCEDASTDSKAVVEIDNALLGKVAATGGIVAIPGTNKSRAKGIVTVVEAPATVEEVVKLQEGKSQKIDHEVVYTVIDPSSESATRFRIKGAGVGFRSDFQSEGRNRITFTADVQANKGGQVRAGIRISR